MNNRYFFITTYDELSSSLLTSVLNQHDDIHCDLSHTDPFIPQSVVTTQVCAATIEEHIHIHSVPEKKINGNIQRFSAFELQHRILVEKTKYPLIKVNIAIDPTLRINLLLKNWSTAYLSPVSALKDIETKLDSLNKNQHNLFTLYNFNYYYNHILNTAASENIKIDSPDDKLFLIALANVLAYDLADLPVGSKTFKLEELVENENIFIDLINYLTSNQVNITNEYRKKINPELKHIKHTLDEIRAMSWKGWQINFLKKYLNTYLKTPYYPHINQPLITYYTKLGYQLGNQEKPRYSKLISIQLNSNRPTQLISYFDNIEETADHPEEIEIIVNIDDDDHTMEALLIKESCCRKFTLKYTTTPKPISFCDLWKPINKLLRLTDPNSYFLLNISDEMLFVTQGWDTILKKYVGFFPDHIFRLRASRNKFRNYFDRWECSFAQDSIPITTKKWVDIGGDWNPCFGPDSYQQLISFYLAKEGQFSCINYLRELPLLDIQFHGDVPSLGIDSQKAWQHNKDHIKAMQICQSYPMQLEAKRRAMLLKANIIAFANQLTHYQIIDVKSKKQIHLINQETHSTNIIHYKLNPLSITLTNQIRKLRFYAFFGGGSEYSKSFIYGFSAYLAATNLKCHHLYLFLKDKLHFSTKEKFKSIIKIPLKLFKHTNTLNIDEN
ncbi:MAG: hypothetical protein KIT56_08325 [Gammaproteobacteria bacterium]|nr:hypothetical protein [Gammaproteobacteria bacterium]MCW5583865.1 hypothetical protein [Gammaproteobacteria bacterium]